MNAEHFDPAHITDADLLDYTEGRMPPARRAAVAARLERDQRLRASLVALRERLSGTRALGRLFPREPLPDDWLKLAAQVARQR